MTSTSVYISPVAATQDYFISVIQSMSDSLVVIGPNNRIAFVNQATQQLLGYTDEELIGQQPSILFADGTFRGDGLETLHERGIVQRGEKILQTRDDRQIPVFYSGSVLRNSQGQIQGIVCVMHDATKQKQLEQGLRNALDKQQELAQLKSQFVSTVSHEFRTPLAIIQANSEFMQLFQDRMDAHQQSAAYDLIQKQVRHMIRLLEGALTVEKMQTGTIPFQLKPIDIHRLCQGIVEALQKRVKRSFVFEYLGEPRSITGDEALIKQAVLNLLSNAIKFSEPNSRIDIILTYNDILSLQIRDKGIGIPSMDQSKLFEPFFRASNTGTIGGLGLGLTMTRMVVEMHGGTLAIDSQVGTGTSVTIQLPVNHPANIPKGKLAHQDFKRGAFV